MNNKALLTGALLAALAGSTAADTLNWVGNSGYDQFNYASNWDGEGYPEADDTAVLRFINGQSVHVWSSEDITMKSLLIQWEYASLRLHGNPGVSSVTADIQSGSTNRGLILLDTTQANIALNSRGQMENYGDIDTVGDGVASIQGRYENHEEGKITFGARENHLVGLRPAAELLDVYLNRGRTIFYTPTRVTNLAFTAVDGVTTIGPNADLRFGSQSELRLYGGDINGKPVLMDTGSTLSLSNSISTQINIIGEGVKIGGATLPGGEPLFVRGGVMEMDREITSYTTIEMHPREFSTDLESGIRVIDDGLFINRGDILIDEDCLVTLEGSVRNHEYGYMEFPLVEVLDSTYSHDIIGDFVNEGEMMVRGKIMAEGSFELADGTITLDGNESIIRFRNGTFTHSGGEVASNRNVSIADAELRILPDAGAAGYTCSGETTVVGGLSEDQNILVSFGTLTVPSTFSNEGLIGLVGFGPGESSIVIEQGAVLENRGSFRVSNERQRMTGTLSNLGEVLLRDATLEVHGTLGTTPSGSIRGNGAIEPSSGMQVSHGRLIPGISDSGPLAGGVIDVIGDLRVTGTGVLEMSLSASTDGYADRVGATGQMTLQNPSLVLDIDPSFRPTDGAVYTILTAVGGISGEFRDLPEGEVVATVDNHELRISYNITSVVLVAHDVTPCPGDLTGDQELDFLDISAFLAWYGIGDLQADLNGDGELDFLDISEFLSQYTMGCP